MAAIHSLASIKRTRFPQFTKLQVKNLVKQTQIDRILIFVGLEIRKTVEF
jgi:hypothetical protein